MYALKRISVGDPGQQLLSVHHAGQAPIFDNWSNVFMTSLVTFFYPSTEWSVEQPFDCTFDCTCGALVRRISPILDHPLLTTIP